MRRLVTCAVAAAALLVPAAPAAGGDQFLPGTACNQGTMNARAQVGPSSPAYQNIPHQGRTPCHHINPTA